MFYNTKIMLFRQMEPRHDLYYLNIGTQQNNPQTGFKSRELIIQLNDMKKYVLVVAVAAALFSCSGNPKADATQTDKNKQETAQVPDMHNAETSLDYWGVYEGTLPAASSPGIKTTLTLNKDKTFTLRSEYIDEKDGIFNDKGTYTLDGNVLTTKQEGGDITYYKVEEGQLKMLDQQKQPITGDLAKFYILKQTKKF